MTVSITGKADATHQITLERNTGRVRAICTTCGPVRFGAWYPTRTIEGYALAQRDGEEHRRDPKPALGSGR